MVGLVEGRRIRRRLVTRMVTSISVAAKSKEYLSFLTDLPCHAHVTYFSSALSSFS